MLAPPPHFSKVIYTPVPVCIHMSPLIMSMIKYGTLMVYIAYLVILIVNPLIRSSCEN